MIVLSSTTEPLPPLCPPTSLLTASVHRCFPTPFEPKLSGPTHSRTEERLHATAETLLLAGRVLQHVYCSRASMVVSDAEYQALTAETHRLAALLMRHNAGHTWPFCGPIIITLKSV